MRRLSLTSWSLHRELTSGAIALTELPARAHAAGIDTLELCHFHLPSTDPAYLAELRAAFAAAGVELFSVLIDAGDISTADPERRAADLAMVEQWIDIAAALGAQGVRVVGGEAPADDAAALERSVEGLRRVAAYAAKRGVRVRTENFKSLLSTSANCNQVLDTLSGSVGLCADIGNFPRARRSTEFGAVAGRAEVVHVKAEYDSNGTLQAAELCDSLDAGAAAGFDGPFTLVFDRGGDSWGGVAELAGVVKPYLA